MSHYFFSKTDAMSLWSEMKYNCHVRYRAWLTLSVVYYPDKISGVLFYCFSFFFGQTVWKQNLGAKWGRQHSSWFGLNRIGYSQLFFQSVNINYFSRIYFLCDIMHLLVTCVYTNWTQWLHPSVDHKFSYEVIWQF